jgi:hypothetical protein
MLFALATKPCPAYASRAFAILAWARSHRSGVTI